MSMPQIDPGVYDEILRLGQTSGGLDIDIARQRAMADYVRKTFGQFPGQARMSGRIASAPGWLELAGALAGQGVGAAADRTGDILAKQKQTVSQAQVDQVLRAMQRQQSTYHSLPGTDIEGGQ